MTLDNDWLDYLNNEESCEGAVVESVRVSDKTPPIASTLYISTKTEIAFLNKELDLYNIFWRLPVTNYDLLESGFVKKQMKFI